MIKAQDRYETFIGEQLKTMAETSLQLLGKNALGQQVLQHYAGGTSGRVEDKRLHTELVGIFFDNPVHFGAGWDKKGRAITGLYHLGFGGGEVGTVLPYGQRGSDQPRLWTITKDHSVGFNRLGFNSPGQFVVEDYLRASQPLPCNIGINVGRNKNMGNDMATWAHGEVIKTLGRFASYIMLGISSPNTPGLRGLQEKGPLTEVILAAKEATDLPVFAKIDAERSLQELDDMAGIAVATGLAGFAVGNTYMASDLKAKYGARWANEAGGLSGADPAYQALTTAAVRHLYEQAGDKLAIIGVGGVNSTEAALEKITAGATLVQVVTAIRPSKGKVAAQINAGLIERMRADGADSIRDYVGSATKRGVQNH